MEIKTKGVVLSRTYVGEKDAIIKILTEDSGIISASAKGVKSMKSKLASGCSLFSYSDFLITESNGRYIVASAVLSDGFYGLSSNIERLSYATYIAELTAAVSPAPEDAKAIIPLLLNTFYLLANSNKDLRLIKCVFELRLLCALGYAPELDGCVECGNSEELCFFSPSEGGIICRDCGTVPDTLIITPDTLDALRYVHDADDKRAVSFALSRSNLNEFENCIEKMSESLVVYRLPSLNYLKQIAGRI
jgi:DNA repair protein RecO (recombination protein O)